MSEHSILPDKEVYDLWWAGTVLWGTGNSLNLTAGFVYNVLNPKLIAAELWSLVAPCRKEKSLCIHQPCLYITFNCIAYCVLHNSILHSVFKHYTSRNAAFCVIIQSHGHASLFKSKIAFTHFLSCCKNSPALSGLRRMFLTSWVTNSAYVGTRISHWQFIKMWGFAGVSAIR